jgi:hypothetical protein
MNTELIWILSFCAFWTVANTIVMTKITRQMTEVTHFIDHITFADIVDYEKKMADLPETPGAAAPVTISPAWDLMRRTHEEILRTRGMEPTEFPWSESECHNYWRSQELVFARQHPEMDKNALFDSLVDKLVVSNMWANAPREEEEAPPDTAPRCGICGKPAVMMRPEERVWRCQEHTQFEVLYNAEPPVVAAAPAPAVQTGDCNATDGADFCDLPAGHGGAHSWAAAPVTHDQNDAFRNMILGKHE